MNIVITSPSLDAQENVSGIASIVKVIVDHNVQNRYAHFQLGKRDKEVRGPLWLLRTIAAYVRWIGVILGDRNRLIHFNLALDARALARDSPLILAARLFRRRMILHLHGGALSADPGSSRHWRYVLRAVLGGKRPVIVLSRLQGQVLHTTLRIRNVVVLPNCIDLRDAMTFERGYPDNEPLVMLFMGRIATAKGLDLIAEALSRLRCRGHDLRFIMAGAGPDERRYIALFRELLADSFEFRGVVSGAQKTALLKRCNVFLLPSLFEGLPMALLEAMSFGLVPVTTSVGSMADVVTDGHNGMVVSAGSAEEIVLAVERVTASRSLRQTLSTNARRFVFDHHSPALYVTRLNQIYQYE